MFVYKIKNRVNGKEYIGQTVKNIYERFNEHCHGSSNCVLLKKAIRKYGKENFEIELVQQCETLEDLDLKEEEAIRRFNSLAPNGYNLMTGGASPRHNDLTKEKMSNTRKGKHPFWATEASRSEESRIKRGNSIRGQKRSLETKLKMKQAVDIICKPIKDQHGKIYRSATDAAKELKLNRANIQMVLRGKRKQTGGFTFKYVTIENNS